MPTQLNERLVAGAKSPPTNQRFLFDATVKGLALRVGASGAKSWMLAARIKGRPRRFALGSYPALGVAAARTLALEAKAAISHGENPMDRRRAERAEATFNEFTAEYFTRHDRPRERTRHGYAAALRRYVPQAWNARRLSDISDEDVAQLHRTVGERHGHSSANGLVRILRAMFNLAVKWKFLPRMAVNPAAGIELFKEHSRARILAPAELAGVLRRLEAEPSPYWRAYFWTVLALGTRRSELLSVRWRDVNLTAGELHFPVTKSGRPHTLPLPVAIRDLLCGLPSYGTDEFIFPGHGATGHLVEPKKAWHAIRTAAGAGRNNSRLSAHAGIQAR
jgi:integrase